MISFILRSGQQVSDLALLSSDSFTITGDDFDYVENSTEKSNEAGAEEIGQRRVKSNQLTISFPYTATTDTEYVEMVNPMLAYFNEVNYIKDLEINRRLKVSPVSISVEHDKGSYRRSGEVKLAFNKLDVSWEEVDVTSESFQIAGGEGVNFDTINFGEAEVRSRIEIVPEEDMRVLSLTCIIPGVNGERDRVIGLISLDKNGEVLCEKGRAIVIDNKKGLVYSSDLKFAVGENYMNGNDIDLDFPNGDIPSLIWGSSFVSPFPVAVQDDSYNYQLRVALGDYWWNVNLSGGGDNAISGSYIGANTGTNYEVLRFQPYRWDGSGFVITQGWSAFSIQSLVDPTQLNNIPSIGPVTVTLPKNDTFDIGGSFTFQYNKTAFEHAFLDKEYDIVIATDGSVYVNSISFLNMVVDKDGNIGPAGGGTDAYNPVNEENIIDLKDSIAPGTSFFKQGIKENGFSISSDVNCQVNFIWNKRYLL